MSDYDGLRPTKLNIPMPPVNPPRAPDTVIVPLTPPRELLVSMAMRLRHDFGVDLPPAADYTPFCGGMTPREREAMLTDMAKLYEEVVGQGFYRWDGSRDRFYQRMGQPGYSTEVKDFNHD